MEAQESQASIQGDIIGQLCRGQGLTRRLSSDLKSVFFKLFQAGPPMAAQSRPHPHCVGCRCDLGQWQPWTGLQHRAVPPLHPQRFSRNWDPRLRLSLGILDCTGSVLEASWASELRESLSSPDSHVWLLDT